jgi:hypothetical protein
MVKKQPKSSKSLHNAGLIVVDEYGNDTGSNFEIVLQRSFARRQNTRYHSC